MPTKGQIAEIKKKSYRSKKVNTDLIEAVGAVVKLKKVGINWFGRCMYCGVDGYFCVPGHGEYWQCLSCGKKGVDVPKVETKYDF